jgi:hypothetical protein
VKQYSNMIYSGQPATYWITSSAANCKSTTVQGVKLECADHSMQHGRDTVDAISKQPGDTRIVLEITTKLMRGGLRSRPFSFVPRGATAAHLRAVAVDEVRRSMERVRRATPELTAADARRAFQSLAPFVDVPEVRAVANWLKLLSQMRQEPPPHADANKWKCASEAFYLVDTLSRLPPTASRHGSFAAIAALLFEALKGTPEYEGADMYSACSAVLAARRKTGLGTIGKS